MFFVAIAHVLQCDLVGGTVHSHHSTIDAMKVPAGVNGRNFSIIYIYRKILVCGRLLKQAGYVPGKDPCCGRISAKDG